MRNGKSDRILAKNVPAYRKSTAISGDAAVQFYPLFDKFSGIIEYLCYVAIYRPLFINLKGAVNYLWNVYRELLSLQAETQLRLIPSAVQLFISVIYT